MLTIRFKQYLMVGLFLITGYLLFLPQGNLTDVFLLPVLPALVVLQLNDLIAIQRKQSIKVSQSVITITDIIFIFIFCFELFLHYCTKQLSYTSFETTNLLAAILVYLGGRAYLNDLGLKWLAYGATFIGIIVAVSLLYTCYDFYDTMLQEGFRPHDLVSLRFLLDANGLMINDWAAILLVFLPFSIYTIFHTSSYWKYITFLCPWIISLAIIYTLSRGAILAWILFILIVVIAAIQCHVHLGCRQVFRWMTTGCFFTFLLCLLPISKPLFSLTTTDVNSVQMQSAMGRLDRWEQIGTIIREHPWQGIGNGNYKLESLMISNQTGASYTGRVNNILLQLILEKGIVGFVIYLILLIVIIARPIRYIRIQIKTGHVDQAFITIVLLAGLCSFLIRELTFTTLFQQSICLYFTVLLILMLPSLAKSKHSVNFFMPSQQIILFLAVFFVPEVLHLQQKQSDVQSYNNRAIEAIEKGDRTIALQQIEAAITIDPSNPILWNNKALFLVESKHDNFDSCALFQSPISFPSLTEALKVCSTASQCQIKEPMFWHNAGWIHLALKDTLAGKQHLEQALYLAPHTPLYLISLGKYHEQNCSVAEAIKLYAKALIVAPSLVYTKFFSDFTKYHPQETKQLLLLARDQLKQEAHQTHNYQTLAKWASIELQLKDTILATQILESVVQHYPNLSRAWMTLGSIYEANNLDRAYQCYHKAYILDQWDPLISEKLRHFWILKNDTAKAASYEQVLNNQQYVFSDQAMRLYRIYNVLSWHDGHYPSPLSRSLLPLIN
ncbi:MAG: O-antigen ligase family protein [Rikenella sp.]|nr:O-antigen ligase family protein [Rikenella sp.]